MTLEQLNNEIKIAENAYIAEKAKNGGRDGSTLAFMLKSRLAMLHDLKDKYF